MAQLKYSAYGAPSKLAMSEDLPLREDRRTAMKQGQAELVGLPEVAGAPQAIELRHLRYFTAVADAGSFTHAAEKMFIAQPTLSQQIRRLEEIVGTPLLQRRREGLQLTPAGTVLLDASRTVLSLVDHEVNRTRQAAGLGRPRLRVVVPPGLPDALAVEAASALRSAAAAADVEIAWLEAPLDAEFSLIRQRRADAGLGWLTVSPEALPAPLSQTALLAVVAIQPHRRTSSTGMSASAVAARRNILLEEGCFGPGTWQRTADSGPEASSQPLQPRMVPGGAQLSGVFLATTVNLSVTGLPGTAKMPPP